MKKTLKLLATMLITISFSFSLKAVNGPGLKRLNYELKNDIMQLTYDNNTRDLVIIEIKNASGEMIRREAIGNNETFTGKIDFNEMGDGSYSIVLFGANKKEKKEVFIYKNASLALFKEGFGNYKLLYGKKGNMPIRVEFLNEYEEAVMKDEFISKIGFAKTYNVSSKKTNAKILKVITSEGSKEFKLK